MKPNIPEVCFTHNIRRPIFHLPNIIHEFAEHMLRYQLIKIINEEAGSLAITAKVHAHSFQGFKLYIKNKVIDSYNDECTVRNCEPCQIIANR